MNYLPSKLTKLRKHYNYSQSYLADVLGVDTLEYMNYENGSKMINYNQMKKLASLYHIDLSEVFKNSDDVKLYDVNKANTDEINIEYFTAKKTFIEKVQDFYEQLFLTSATGKYLDLHGKDYAVYRKTDESDEDYRERIVQEKLEHLTPEYLKSIYGLTLYVFVDDFDASENTLTSDNVYINHDGYMAEAPVDLQRIIEKKFVLKQGEIQWL